MRKASNSASQQRKKRRGVSEPLRRVRSVHMGEKGTTQNLRAEGKDKNSRKETLSKNGQRASLKKSKQRAVGTEGKTFPS